MHTPEQASQLWCPMVRIARHEVITNDDPASRHYGEETAHIVGGCNTDALGRHRVPASCHCIADECAMWRWSGATGSDGRLLRIVGYCGMAGAPASPPSLNP